MEVDTNMASRSKHTQSETVDQEKSKKKRRLLGPRARRTKSSLGDGKCLDLVLIVEFNIELNKYIAVIQKHYKYIIKMLKRDRKELRVSLVKYWNFPPEGRTEDPVSNVEICNFASSDEDIMNVFESITSSGPEPKDAKQLRSRYSFPGEIKGLADAFYKVNHLTFRRNANKVCILLAASTHRISKHSGKSLEPHPYTSPDHDIVVLTRLLASRGVSLHVIGCLPNNVRLKYNYKEIPAKQDSSLGKKKQHVIDFATEFYEPKQFEDDSHILEALAHLSGGRYIPIFSTNCLTKIVVHLVMEDVAWENLMGFVNDEVTIEVDRQFGDANVFHLSQRLCERFTPEQVKCLQLNTKPVAPICNLSERLSWASNFDEMQEIFTETTPSCVNYPKPHPILNVADVRFSVNERLSEDSAMKVVRRLLCRVP